MDHREEQLKIRIAEAFERVATALEELSEMGKTFEQVGTALDKLNDRIDEERWTPLINRDHESKESK